MKITNLKRTSMIILLAVASIFICTLFIGQNFYAYADDNPADLSSESLENDCDHGHLLRIDFVREERIGGELVEVRYYPVFDAEHYPEGAHFFGADGKEYTTMDPGIRYATVPEGTKITVVRDIKTSYDSVYGPGDKGVKEAIYSWRKANLASGENVEKLSERNKPSGVPKINNIRLTTIWKYYNPYEQSRRFGGSYGQFWSCVSCDERNAWYWDSHNGIWYDINRDVDDDFYVCVSRDFSLNL